MVRRKVRLGLRKPRFFLGILTSILIVSSFSILAPSVRADTSATPIDVTSPTSCQTLLAGSYTNPQSGIGQIASSGRGSAVCSWSLSNLSGAEHIRLSFEMNSSVPTPGPFGPRVTASLGFATSVPVRLDTDLSAIFPNSTKTTTTTLDCCFQPAFLAFESDLWINPDAPLSGDRITKICQQQFPGYADDNVFHSYSIDVDIASQTTTWTADGGAASASCSRFTFVPTQLVFYARSTDDGNSMIAQIRDITVSTTAQQPDFVVSVSPTNLLVVRSGGWNASISVLLQSMNGFQGTVNLNYTADPAIVPAIKTLRVVDFQQNSVFLNSSSQMLVGMNVSIFPKYDGGNEWPALGKYPVVLNARSGNLSHQVSVTVDVRAAIRGVMNILEFGAIGQIASSLPNCSPFTAAINCFTAQQNFWIEAPNGTRVYWAQNVALFAPLNVEGCVVGLFGKCLYHVTIFKGWELFPVFQVWDKDIRNTVLSCLPLIGAATNRQPFPGACSGNFFVPRFATTPFAVNFTSTIVGNRLMMSNDAATIAGPLGTPSGTLPIPDGSFIVGASPMGTQHEDPEMVVVGPPGALGTHPSVAFLSYTYGYLSSRELLFDSRSWEIPIGTILPRGNTVTGEFSVNLQWTDTGDFHWVDPSLGHLAMDQGLALRPDYSLPNP